MIGRTLSHYEILEKLGSGGMGDVYVAQDPFDRFPTNGFRCALYPASPGEEDLAGSLEMPYRDFLSEKPVSDEIFHIYKGFYAYDKTELNAATESVDESSEDWIKEKVSFDAAYGSERVLSYLYLPKKGVPPYQTMIIFPGSGAIHRRSSESFRTRSFDFIIKSGRAVMYPIYKGTYERGGELDSDYPNETNFYKEHVFMWAKDLGRSIDYLEARDDIDADRLAYYGLSWGGSKGNIMLAVEERFRGAVLWVAGLSFQKAQPEVDEINFVTRVTLPVLMLNGRFDHFFPVETSQTPMFELLGTPSEHKRHVISDSGHYVPRPQWIRETLAWLDRYLGPVN